MALICVTEPVVEPVTLAEAKLHMRVDVADDDTLIAALVKTAREYIETITRPRVAMVTQTWRYVADEFPRGDTLELRPWPLQSVVSVTYTDDDDLTATVPSTDYLVDTSSAPGRLRLRSGATWPSVTLRELNGLTIEFKAGYGDTGASVPAALRQAILLLIGQWYENRESSLVTGAVAKELPFAVHALMAPWRREV
jgi:uncharacterized phiE125 gp8 family phage protein